MCANVENIYPAQARAARSEIHAEANALEGAILGGKEKTHSDR